MHLSSAQVWQAGEATSLNKKVSTFLPHKQPYVHVQITLSCFMKVFYQAKCVNMIRIFSLAWRGKGEENSAGSSTIANTNISVGDEECSQTIAPAKNVLQHLTCLSMTARHVFARRLSSELQLRTTQSMRHSFIAFIINHIVPYTENAK